MPYKNLKEMLSIPQFSGLKSYHPKAKKAFFHVVNKCLVDAKDESPCFKRAWGVAKKVQALHEKKKAASDICRVAELLVKADELEEFQDKLAKFLDSDDPKEVYEIYHWANKNRYDFSLVVSALADYARDAVRIFHKGQSEEKGVVEEDVDPKELEDGIKVEMEHTSDPLIAKKISLDHLAEDPKYYTKLKTIHKD